MPGSKPDLASRRAVAGAILAQGAPLGWLGLRWAFSGSPPAQELARSPGLYLYLLLSTTAAFAAFGFVLGAYEESLADASERIARLTRTDPLTRLGNARALGEELPRLASLAKRS
ncbi:MAG TPA: hypothetical protein VHF22_01385, partial [Planctomycetota bacterium]|nr:hypothetical protein [Planctomycetota bacterium]